MGRKMDMLNHQRRLMSDYSYLMDDYGRAWNEAKLQSLEAEAFDELRKELIQAVREEQQKATTESAKQFAGEVNKAFKSLGLK